jgi:SAM-dependent methyltransferase
MATDRQNPTQSVVNSDVWRTGRYLRAYNNRVLTLPEVSLFVRYSSKLSGRVLDLGCGAGRVLEYLLLLGADAYGLDISPAMAEHCRSALPEASVIVGDVANLTTLVSGRFSAVLASDNLLDVFSDAERRHALIQIREVLEPDGILMFSSHDLAYVDNPPPDAGDAGRVTVGKFFERTIGDITRAAVGRPRAIRNRRRLSPLQQRNGDHAILNDPSHHYSLLHYYIRRDDQERQLDELGYELLECLDTEGRPVGPAGTGPGDCLYYVARPR